MGRGMKRLGRPETGPEEGVGSEVYLAEILTAKCHHKEVTASPVVHSPQCTPRLSQPADPGVPLSVMPPCNLLRPVGVSPSHLPPLHPQPMRHTVALYCLVALEVEQALCVLLAGRVPVLDREEVCHCSGHEVGIGLVGILCAAQIGRGHQQRTSRPLGSMQHNTVQLGGNRVLVP